MIELGPLAINLAFVLSAYAVVMSLVGAGCAGATSSPAPSTPRSPCGAAVLVAVAALLHALVIHDFRLEYVAALQQQHAAALLHRSPRCGAGRRARCSSGC